MLQQTQVKTVLERYYYPFLKQFPTLAALAKADEPDVLKAWQGLGYYSRARNLHKAAKQCAGILPDDFDALLALPGIGKNTAHAILAFGFAQAVPVMEANLKRVLSRVFALTHPTEQMLWERAWELLDRKNSFDYNQAMMDIGAMVCTKRAPACPACPLNSICEGKSSPLDYPAPKKAKAVPVRKQIITVYESGGKYYLTPRTTKFLGGLYGFPECDGDNIPPIAGCDDTGRGKQAERAISLRSSVSCILQEAKYGNKHITKLGSITQTYSHFKLEAEVYLSRTDSPPNSPDWYSLAQIAKLPISKADEKVIALLCNKRMADT